MKKSKKTKKTKVKFFLSKGSIFYLLPTIYFDPYWFASNNRVDSVGLKWLFFTAEIVLYTRIGLVTVSSER